MNNTDILVVVDRDTCQIVHTFHEFRDARNYVSLNLQHLRIITRDEYYGKFYELFGRLTDDEVELEKDQRYGYYKYYM